MNGYLARRYAESLSHVGSPLTLPQSGSWAIQREIQGSAEYDAMGCYPLMACTDWRMLAADLAGLKSTLVSFTMVTDPLGDFDHNLLESTFPDLCKPFKQHHLVDLQGSYMAGISSNHLRNAKKAAKQLAIIREEKPIESLPSWESMYGNLIKRHQIEGVAAFSSTSFAAQFETPGLVVYSAFLNDQRVGMVVFYVMNNHVYYHLGAYREAGYDKKASFGIFRKAIDDFSQEDYTYLNMGGGAGMTEDAEDGLTRFKRGWSSEVMPAYLCGVVLNELKYEKLVTLRGNAASANPFFPAYRSTL